MRFCCWECGWCWCWRERDVDFSVKPGAGVGDGTEHDDEANWAKKFLDFRDILKYWFEFDRHADLDDDDLMFSLLLALYSVDLISRDSIEGIEEESLIADEMKAIYARDPSVIEFYLPQLCTYLASNGFDSDLSPRVMSFLFIVCRKDVRLAHRVMWHINAFCFPSTIHGAQLMKRCVEREGAISARAILPKLGVDPLNSHTFSMLQSTRLENMENGVVSHFEEADECKNGETVGSQQLFYSCLDFVEALTQLSAQLIEVEPNNRETYVRDALNRINKDFLCRESAGSELVYIPMGQRYCRALRIIPSESLLLTTKERVPLFLTLEVESFELNQLGIGNYGQEGSKDNVFNLQFDVFRRKLIDGFTNLREKALSGHVKDESRIHHKLPTSRGSIPDDSGRSSSIFVPPVDRNDVNLGQWADPLPKMTSGKKESEILHEERHFSDSEEDFHPLVYEVTNSNPNGGASASTTSESAATYYLQAQEPGTRCGNKNGKTKCSPLLLTPNATQENDQDGQGGIYGDYPKPPTSGLYFNEVGDVVDEDEEHDAKLDEMVTTDGNDQEELIIFKERWIEKEARIWQQGVLYDPDDGRSSVKQPWTGCRKDDVALLQTGSASNDPDQACDDEREVRRCGDSGGSWSLVPIIVKSNDDLRQEQAVSQLIALLDRIWHMEKVGVWVYSYSIMAISPTAGIIEAIPDTLSLHALKTHTRKIPLDQFFKCYFLKKKGGLRQARSNFVKSCAGYAIVCYLLQIKDRHNGNILLDAEGHLVHIDWGFVLGLSPGGNFGFENAPFKLTTEMVSIMGGTHSFAYNKFRILCVRAFLEARRHREKLILLVEMLAENRDLPCFSHCDPRTVVEGLRDRFLPDKTPSECADIIYEIIASSKASWRTSIYDWFQKYASGVL